MIELGGLHLKVKVDSKEAVSQLRRFGKDVDVANKQMQSMADAAAETAASGKKSMAEYRSDVMKLAQTYKKQGMDMSSAMKRAYAEIDKSQYETANNSEQAAKKFAVNWDKAGEKLRGVASKAGQAAIAIGKATVKAFTISATGVATLATMATKSYADYEQLVGGIDTLFEDLSDDVQANAANAFKTVGMSTNEYMETAMGFSAALTASLKANEGDISRSADATDQIITDMADNANKMGSSMESIEHAYAGFAKQNYTMLDNLKLGYGGTKEEMQRLLSDAEKLTGKKFDLSNFADVAEAIHVIQTEMGITGTTAKEAAGTISGSMAMTKSAFKNLVRGVADEDADLEALIQDFVDSVSITAQNLLPVVEQTLNGAIILINQLLPVIMQRIPALIAEYLPKIVAAGVEILKSIVNGIQENKEELIQATFDIINTLVAGLIELLPDILATGLDILVALIEGLASDPDAIIDTAIELVDVLLSGLIDKWPDIVIAATKLVYKFIAAIIGKFPDVLKLGTKIIEKLIDGVKETFGRIKEVGQEIIDAFKEGISNAWEGLKEWFNGLWDSLFGNRSVDVSVNGDSDGSHRVGLRSVPYDGYVAELHKGERILTAAEARKYENNEREMINNTITVNNYSPKALDEAESARLYRRSQRQLALGF